MAACPWSIRSNHDIRDRGLPDAELRLQRVQVITDSALAYTGVEDLWLSCWTGSETS